MGAEIGERKSGLWRMLFKGTKTHWFLIPFAADHHAVAVTIVLPCIPCQDVPAQHRPISSWAYRLD